jgi:putative GTP pyrophosphokinase
MDTKKYKTEIKNYIKLDNAALCVLKEALKGKCKIHSIESRIKSPLSLFDKAQKKNIHPFKDIHDILGLRVVCLYLSDIEKIRQILRDSFEVVEEEDRTRNREPNSLDFGINIIAKLKNPAEKLIEIKDYLFEIQVRTMSQNAIAIISHDLHDKTNHPIQENLESELFALDDLLHVADSQFDILRKKKNKNSNKTRPWVFNWRQAPARIDTDILKQWSVKWKTKSEKLRNRRRRGIFHAAKRGESAKVIRAEGRIIKKSKIGDCP